MQGARSFEQPSAGVVTVRERRALGQGLLLLIVALLSVVAWIVLWRFGSGPYLQHHPGHDAGLAPLEFFALFVLGWTVMSMAMMLPTSLPVLVAFHKTVEERSGRALLLTAVVAGYLAAWVLFGVLVYLGGTVTAQIVKMVAPIRGNHWLVSGLIVVIAGVFQFTGFKDRCLQNCRAPARFVTRHWDVQGRGWQALRLGALHGAFCVGCCWALMLLMYVVSSSNLGWMLLLAAVMAVEKSARWGSRITVPLGVVLLIAGATMIALGPVNSAAHIGPHGG